MVGRERADAIGSVSHTGLRPVVAISKQRFSLCTKIAKRRKGMAKKIVKFEYEKETKNSVRYTEVPDEGTAPIMGTLYVQKWFAGNSKTLEITIEKKD
ncbi:hypothetical protein GCM10023333_28410 [Ferrimonas pelagia]|uniref:Uncharacterized protein n=2 Tax=Ferrimonas pelagia TaxID=1177826 RepID=A0ABP9F5Q4_9GAMM